MAINGKYIYGIIETTHDHRFGPIGLHDEEVLTIGLGTLAMVVSHYESDEDGTVTSSRKNLMAHQRVLECVMERHTVLPVKFGTVADGEAEARNLLLRHEAGFLRNLRDLDNQVELGLKVLWTDMPAIYQEVLEASEPIRRKKAQIAGRETTNDLIEVGQLVEQALLAKKQQEAEQVLELLKAGAARWKPGKLLAEPMLLNASFLVSRGREREFDQLVAEAAERWEGRAKFKYVGPLAPYSFVELGIYPEAWEA